MNSPQPDIFHPDHAAAPRPPDGAFRIMHHGLIAHRHGIDLLIRALPGVRAQVPNLELCIYGQPTPFLDEVLALARQLGVEDAVKYCGARSQAEIARAITACDLGIIPNRRSAFTEINLPTRLFEYLAMRRPVIAPLTQGICDYFDDDALVFFDPDDPASLTERILWVYHHPEAVASIVARGHAVYRRHLWTAERGRFVSIVENLAIPA